MAAKRGNDSVQAFIDEMNKKYDTKHRSFEENFWSTKMNLKDSSFDELTRTKNEYEGFLRDKGELAKVREHLKKSNLSDDQQKTLKCMERTFLCYLMENEEAAKIKEELTHLEGELEKARNNMVLGYVDPATKEFKAATTHKLRILMRTDSDEAVRKACYEGIQEIGKQIAKPFAEIVKLRTRMAKLIGGYEDFYDYKVQQSEGFSKKRLFEILDKLEKDSRPIMDKAYEKIQERKGEAARKPWNTSYMLAGDVTKLQDPYFAFANAVDSWARSFAALGIKYRGATMNLDLFDRQGKYCNGFCHWPQCAYRLPDGSFQPSVTNFTSLSNPTSVGSGHDSIATLMHEGGHAAHFANIDQPSPFFSQERSPTSVAYAENQSMFLDSLVDDADWLVRYARNADGQPIPWDLIKMKIENTHDYAVLRLRGMLVVSYFEKALYELKEDEVTPERILQIAEETDRKIYGGPAPRPVISVPHILSDESSCYYQGYILAEMSVYQTRAHFLAKYGKITDLEEVGKDLTEQYWRAGNSVNFLDLVKGLTGKPLSADDWVNELKKEAAEKIAEEKAKYEAAKGVGPKFPPGFDATKALEMRMRLVHGDELIADTKIDSFTECNEKLKRWIAVNFKKE